ncbi:MAG: dihydroxy-acid dehydratase [Betaproteobacteria bacterium]|nr:MAG: dihydroxy-acid dehydratase [Betaproteobacteria bacterium]TMH65518.1 MAG: dihydroxy-acid dehydratase [Betaproteobacteria bacterium]
MAQGMRKGLTRYGDPEFSLFLRKAFIKAMGHSDEALSRPIVGVADTSSDYNPCHGNVAMLVEAVKRGVLMAGGLPMAFPTISIHESFAHPTSMFLRNLMSMDTEEMIRAQPMDSVVLIGGCDKTIPAQLMAAASIDVPAIVLPTGPMLVGHYKGEVLGACSDCRRFWAQHRAGKLDLIEVNRLTERLAPTMGTCMVMGTASSMACIAEALGIALPGSASIPAMHADRIRLAEATGRTATEMAQRGPQPADLLTPAAFNNALTALQALGGSTNALVHLSAIAGRRGIAIDLDAFDQIGRKVPVLVDLKPAGQHYMEDFHHAGGMPRLLREIAGHLDLSTPVVGGGTLADYVAGAEDVPGQQVIRSLANPVSATGSMAVLRGNLAPRGAVIKHSAATPDLLQHEGRAVVFDDLEDLSARVDDPMLDVRADDILVLRNAGPKGGAGMPEAGYLPIPKKLAREGINDMVRISDARMSGTAFGTIVLHITPESAVGGPLACVRNGDRIRLDVAARRIDLLIEDDEMAARMRDLAHLARTTPDRGYAALFDREVLQADEGCDFEFMRPRP